ncbi:MAG: helicase RepA family protein [Intrasporangiaceae bacterium]|nr:helicase RepA family protein [Intrasporangiaceae bacterium]
MGTGRLSMLFGAPKTGKSYAALQVAWSYANGTSWFRRKCRTEPGKVLYLAGEGVADLKLRVEALVADTDMHPGGNLMWWTSPLSLFKERDAAKLRLEVERHEAGLVVVDTWRRFSGLVDENDAGATSQAVGALEDLTAKGVSVLVVHHTNAEGGIRGSTALAGAVESAARAMVNENTGKLVLDSRLARRGVGFSDIELDWKRSGPDAVLREVFPA